MLPFQRTGPDTYWINDSLELEFDANDELEETLIAVLIERQQARPAKRHGVPVDVLLERALRNVQREKLIQQHKDKGPKR